MSPRSAGILNITRDDLEAIKKNVENPLVHTVAKSKCRVPLTRFPELSVLARAALHGCKWWAALVFESILAEYRHTDPEFTHSALLAASSGLRIPFLKALC